ncbi:MAG: NAD(P)H-dependent oxidoreductase [Oscillospiraceae bacterium]|nr:NAD(P)H-dependent oxidoreductase [Oscillospiraceae bacterium]
MRNIVAINVSPRKTGTSAMLLQRLKDALEPCEDHVHILHLYSHLQDMRPIFDAVDAADTIVLSGPCYANTYPADTTRLLEALAARPDVFHGQNLYGIIQGGMPYAHTHVSGLNMLKAFSRRVNLPYQGGFIIGGGAMLDGRSVTKLPNGKTVERQLLLFSQHIHRGEASPDSVYEASILKLPRFATRLLALWMNRQIDKTFAARGMDAYQPSPYLDDEIS